MPVSNNPYPFIFMFCFAVIGWVATLYVISESLSKFFKSRNILQPISDPFENLPPKDEELSNREQGLYDKYYVRRRDLSDRPGGKHDNCQYFVLDLTHDPYALETAHYYSKACEGTHPLLAKDLKRKVSLGFQDMEDKGEM